MHGDGLANDEAIGNELAHRLAGVGVGNLVDFVRIEPDLTLATAGHRSRQALLRTEIDPDIGMICQQQLGVRVYFAWYRVVSMIGDDFWEIARRRCPER